LESGHLGGAAIDHFGDVVHHYEATSGQAGSSDPKPAVHPLMALSQEANDRFIATSHIAGVTAPAFTRMLKVALDNLSRVNASEDPMHVVNGVSKARS
jgi:lactate dehydrogenase-like 2-hydroxyacid dehydrogenase